MVEDYEIDDLDTQLASLQNSIVGTTQVSAAFQSGLENMKSSLSETDHYLQGVSNSFNSQLGTAFQDLIFEGGKLSDVLKGLAQSMINTSFDRAVSPLTGGLADAVTKGLGGLIGGLFGFKKGGAFSSGRVMPFAKGGVVTAPTTFPMRSGTGLMGEAGPEAIMPLSRGADGSLGVRAQAASGVVVNMNISTPDVQGFERSRSQIAAGVSRAIQRGQKNF
ncbi:MAG: phage tail tape measure protein [Pseudomonadota bacterium]